MKIFKPKSLTKIFCPLNENICSSLQQQGKTFHFEGFSFLPFGNSWINSSNSLYMYHSYIRYASFRRIFTVSSLKKIIVDCKIKAKKTIK